MEISKIWIDDDAVNVQTPDGRVGRELFSDYPRLCNAPREALEDFSVDNFGIHWNRLNEDLCFEGFFKEKHENPLYKLFMSLPEINVAALARRLGMGQGEMARYTAGSENPPKEKMEKIVDELKKIGAELLDVSL